MAIPPLMALISQNQLSHQHSNHAHTEHVKLLEVESQHLSFCSHMQQFQSEGAQTVKRKKLQKHLQKRTTKENLQFE